MKSPFTIVKEVASSQSKGCWLFIQIGCSALVVRQMWGKPRDVAVIHAEIDTPYQRCRVSVYGIGPRNRRGNRSLGLTLKTVKPNGSYRDRWLRKLNYI